MNWLIFSRKEKQSEEKPKNRAVYHVSIDKDGHASLDLSDDKVQARIRKQLQDIKDIAKSSA